MTNTAPATHVGFGQAIAAVLEEGREITRQNWLDRGWPLRVGIRQAAVNDFLTRPVIWIMLEDGYVEAWTPGQGDMPATDWIILGDRRGDASRDTP